MIQENDLGIDAYHPNTPHLIQADESFSVPLFPDKKGIPMLRILEAVRQAGTPLILVVRIAKSIIEEAQEERLGIPFLTTHRTAKKQICSIFPTLPRPMVVNISHQRILNEIKAGLSGQVSLFQHFLFLDNQGISWMIISSQISRS